MQDTGNATNTIKIRDYLQNTLPYLTSGICALNNIECTGLSLNNDIFTLSFNVDIKNKLNGLDLYVSNVYEKLNVSTIRNFRNVVILTLEQPIYYGRRSIAKCYAKIGNDYIYCNVRGDLSRILEIDEVSNQVVINIDYFKGFDYNNIGEFYFVAYNNPYNKKVAYGDITFIDNNTISYEVDLNNLQPILIDSDKLKLNGKVVVEILSSSEELQIQRLQELFSSKTSFITILDNGIETINAESSNTVVNQNNLYYILQDIRIEVFIFNDDNARLGDKNNIILDKMLNDLRTIMSNIKHIENSDIVDISFLGSSFNDYNMTEDNKSSNQVRLYNTRFFNFQIKTFVDYDAFDQINKQQIYRDLKIGVNDKLHTPYINS